MDPMRSRPRRQYLEFDGKSSKDFWLFLSAPGVYNSPAPDVETVSIPGMNGDLIRDNARPGLRRFGNVDIQYDAFFLNGLPVKTQAIKSWLQSPVGFRKLWDTYDPDFFRMAVCTQAPEFDVTRNRAAQISLTFNCKPQRWSTAGEVPVTFTESGKYIHNPFEFYSQPVIRVSGKSSGTITVGEYSVEIQSFSDDVILNSETQNAYHPDGSFCNDVIYSEEFPIFAPGMNEIVWNGGITSAEVTPRWWTL